MRSIASGCQPVLVPIFEFGNENFVFYAMYRELFSYSFVRRLTCGIIVHTEIDGINIWVVFQHLKQHLISDTAGSSVAVASPIFFMHRNKGQHIYGSLKEIERVVRTRPVETVTRIAAYRIAFVFAVRARSAFMGMTGNAFFIITYEYGIVIVGRFIDHFFINKSREYLLVYPSAIKQICIYPPHIIVFRRKGERLWQLSLDRLGLRRCAVIVLKQVIDGLRIVHIIKMPSKVNGIAADAFVLMKPQVSSDRYLF